jgi:two-component system, OmpR family, phosphate regulon sensor histidine kinase PhoR
MRGHIFFKLLGSFALVILVVMAVVDLTVTRAWEKSLRSEIETSLKEKVQLFAARVEQSPLDSYDRIARETAAESDARVTIITSDGQVLADSEANPSEMENHRTRPEFSEALQGRIGTNVRRSHTVGVDFLYAAAPIPGGAVRLAHPLRAIANLTRHIHLTLLGSSLIAALLAIIIAAFSAQSVAGRLNRILQFAQEVASGNLSVRLADDSNDEIGHVASALDSTARKLEDSFRQLDDSRRELDSVLNSMQEAVIAVGRDMRVQWANQRLERMLPTGVRRGYPLVESVRDPELLRVLQFAVEARGVVSARATTIAPGKLFNITAAPMPGGGAVAVMYDLTEVERVEKTRRDFIANVSHELRTPLTSIQGYAETLLETERGPSAEFLEIIRKNAIRMTRLTEDLLALACVESGEHKLKLQPVLPSELLQEAAQYTRERFGQSMTVEIQCSALKTVSADRDAIFQVFTNFIDNAAKYADKGRRIELGAKDVDRGVQFYVRDFGPGIPSEHLTRIFERFYRVDKARSRESGGTGLGLAIAKHIVLAHGGSILAESELHHGSTFLFTLPEAADA